MRRTLVSAAVLAFSLAAASTPALAMPCKDAHGKFMKCPPPKPMLMMRCKDDHGRFMKCGLHGAHPV